jgi:uncharacterized protein with ParB-like and HNH nuclease domain/predicted transport protein
MKATETNLLKFLQGTRQFVIPIYQRTYSWTLEQCQQLWNDIIRSGIDEDVSGHFVGSVVYIERGLYQISSVPQVLVIDGQQRLTTVMLLLAALGRVIDEHATAGEINRKKLDNYYLYNAEEEGDLRYKLLLTRGDKETLMRIIDEAQPTSEASKHVDDNFTFFLQQVRRTDIDPWLVFKGLSKLIIVDISLDRNYDNPQLIFESLNSTGLELSQADLIRNYVLMGLDVQEQASLYNTYWYPMERRLSRPEYVPMFDRFMRDYLTVKSRSGAIPNINEVYASFKAYRATQGPESIAEIVADIYRYAQYFIKLAYAEDPDRDIAAVLGDINALKVDVAYPFLLEVADDYANSLLSRDDFLRILRLVESYVFRRSTCGIPTNSLNKTFATLTRELDKAHYLESVEAAFLAKDSYRRFPRDPEFMAAFVVKDMYNFRSRNYLLRKLENLDRKEPITVEEYTIEHVMPQNENLSAAWREELGPDWRDVQATYLHTIGNLTLTGYNSEMSDKPFYEKRHIIGGFDESPLRLNQSIAHLDHWDRDAIVARANALAQKSIKIWPAPSLPQEVLARYTRLGEAEGTRSYALNETNYGSYLQGDVLALFENLRKRILNLDSSVREEIKAYYIAYKTTTNFVDVQPQKQRLRLTLNMRFDEIDDPKSMCRDITNIGRWGNGDVELGLATFDQVDDIMWLVYQSFEKQREDSHA